MGTSAAFTATVSAITDAFGDPTRRRIYLYVRDQADRAGGEFGVTTSAVADEVGVHPNVARHHLDKLAAGGYLEVHTGKVPGAKTLEDVRRFYEAQIPMGRGCDPVDVTRALLYSVEQKYETGQAIPVTGGQVMLN